MKPVITQTIKEAFTSRYLCFNQRMGRARYWSIMVLVILCMLPSLVLYVIDSELCGVVATVTIMALFGPTLSCTVRRLHDTNHSAKLLLTVFGSIALGVLFIYESSAYEIDPYSMQQSQDEADLLKYIGYFIIILTNGALLFMLSQPTYPGETKWDNINFQDFQD